MDMREKVVFAPLVLLVLWMGIYPASFTTVMEASVDKLVQDFQSGSPRRPDGSRRHGEKRCLSGWFTQE